MDEKPRQTRTAYRLETDRLLLRCWSPEDAPRLRAALDVCDAHLRPMIPFMKDEPRTLQQTARWLRGHRAAFDLGQFYRYAVYDTDEKNLLGENMLLTRVGPGGLEIGYWTHKDAPENGASVSIATKLGFTHEATLKKRGLDSEGRMGDLMIWSLFAADYSSSPAANITFRAFDCMGEAIT